MPTNHTRAGTVPDQRGRCGMYQGVVGCVVLRKVEVCSVWVSSVTVINHHAVGAVSASTPDGGLSFVEFPFVS